MLSRKTDVPKVRQKMNMVFQSFNLFAHLSVLENLTLAPIRLRGVGRRVAEDKARDLLRLVGLGEKAERFPGRTVRRPEAARRDRSLSGYGTGDHPL